jgi:predicted Rossmann fold flavoprotein
MSPLGRSNTAQRVAVQMEMSTLRSSWDVIVAGGGPAGFFAAIRCAELNPNLRVLIIEKARQTLGKVLISGGGRCNVTHACFDAAKLITYYPRGANELLGAFTRFQPKHTVEWFESRGVKLKTEADGRMFPVTDSAATIADCLHQAAKKAGVQVILGTTLLGMEKSHGDGFRLGTRRARMEPDRNEPQVFHLQTRQLLIATGSDRKTWQTIKALGHTVIDPVPSLFTFNIKDQRIAGLAGVSVEHVTLKMDSVTAHGPLLITHWGMSGPAVLRCSAWGARELLEKNYKSSLLVNWLDDYSPDKALEVLRQNRVWKENSKKKVSTHPAFSQIPVRLWKQLTEFIAEKNWADVSNAELRKLAEELTVGEFRIEGKGKFKEEFVTCGGVSLKEVDFRIMQSRLVAGLFFAGEVLDMDGLTGGFNFQSSWTTGWLAGNALAENAPLVPT